MARSNYHHLYYLQHKEKWDKDKEKRRLYMRRYYQRNLKRMREKGRKYTTKYRKKFPDQTATASERCRRKRNARNRHFIDAYKIYFGCAVCGERDPVVLDAHHRNPKEKEFRIGEWLNRGSLGALANELAKCEILCANDHRRKHAKTSCPTRGGFA